MSATGGTLPMMEKYESHGLLLGELAHVEKPTFASRVRNVAEFCTKGACILAVACLATLYIFQPQVGDNRALGIFRSRDLSAAEVSSSGHLLRDFQVYPPVLTPDTTPAVPNSRCDVTNTIMDYVFANSYGHPFVGTVTPPNCKFNRVILNLTITSAGRQFDRLAIVYLGNTEIWRTSTAEPTQTGIIFGYTLDASNFLALWQMPQKLIFDLGNLIDSTYTGSYNATLTAQYFTSPDTVQPADQIIPISSRMASMNQSSVFTVPTQNASNTVSLPRNIEKAVFSISSCGQIAEEFWYGNTFNTLVNTFESNPADGTLYGGSPFREVQLYIDGMLAGVAWPFPIVFTGGIVPGLWRPIVGINAFDLKQDEIDISPFLPLLCNGKQHTFEIRVTSINNTADGGGVLAGNVPSYWLVTGTIFLWLGKEGSITTGSDFHYGVPEPTIGLSYDIGKNSTGGNKTLSYTTDVSRHLVIKSNITTSSGQRTAIWQQFLNYKNIGNYTKYGDIQYINQNTTGYHYSNDFARRYSYPVDVVTGFFLQSSGNFTITATVSRGLDDEYFGFPVFPTGLQSFTKLPKARPHLATFQGSSLSTSQHGTAQYMADPNTGVATGFGSTQQGMTFSGIVAGNTASGKPLLKGSKELYERHVSAVNSTIIKDSQTLVGSPYNSGTGPGAANQAPAAGSHEFPFIAPVRLIGRGPRK